jgi:hypothetical protein
MPNPDSNGWMSRRLLFVTAATRGAEQLAATPAAPPLAPQSLFRCPSGARPALARPDGCHALAPPTPGLLRRCLARASSGPEARACAAPTMSAQILGKRVGGPLGAAWHLRCLLLGGPAEATGARAHLVARVSGAASCGQHKEKRPSGAALTRRRLRRSAPSRWTWSWRPRSPTPTTRTGRCPRSWMRRRPPSGRGPSRRRRLYWCRRCGPAAGRTATRQERRPRVLLPMCRPATAQACRGECAAGAALLEGLAPGGCPTEC